MNLPSVMSHQFSQVPQADIQRSSFNRSHGYKTTFDSGYLVPVLADEMLPGDTFNCKMTAFTRLSTPIVPVMDNLYLDSFFFFVPLRLIWSNFKKFMGEQANPADSTSYVVPQMTPPVGGYQVGSLSDYLGIPTGIPNAGSVWTHSTFWHRAYNLIWNEWFRDQNLQNSVTVDLGDGPDTDTNYVLLKRGKRHDYFTSALPWPQKGTAVSIPLGTSAPITGLGTQTGATITAASTANVYYTGASAPVTNTGWLVEGSGSAVAAGESVIFVKQGSGNYPDIKADLSNATAATINSLRQAFQVQKLYERDARGGTRYTEIILAHFGVKSPDARLQRPEYLGGGSSPITFTPIPQTSSTDATTPQGHLAAYATATHRGSGFTYSATEHGVILGLVNVRADLNYQQGLNKMFSRSTRLDFYWPALSHVGEQSILNKEIYLQGSGGAAADALTFGYQERYAEYRYKPSQITGKFRSTAASTLDVWHLAEKFTSLPTLNSTFISAAPPINRIQAVTTEPQLMGDFYFDYKCARPMPVYGVPGLIDHF